MKKLTRSIFRKILEHDWIWELCPSWLREKSFIRVQRGVALEERFKNLCSKTFIERKFLNGPFRGLYFPTLNIQGSALFPRLVGSYESELHTILERLLNKSYDSVIDIGFAEGYYLIGLGKRLKNAKLIGFDISSEAHELCSNLSISNDISNERIFMLGECNPSTLSQFLPSKNSLLLCDCEGFEAQVFSENDKSIWLSSDIIVECHDFIKSGVTESICSILKDTHAISLIYTSSSEEKLEFLNDPMFNIFKTEEKLRLVSEGRPSKQCWIVAEAIYR